MINASSMRIKSGISNTLGKTLGGYVFNLNEYVGDLYIKVKPVSTGEECSVSSLTTMAIIKRYFSIALFI